MSKLVQAKADVVEKLKSNPFALSKAVFFELSDRCNLASKHPSCPAGKRYEEEKIKNGTLKYNEYLEQGSYLAEDVVMRVMRELGEYQFSGTVNFHRYNEPLIELEKVKRLSSYCRALMPESSIIVYTNALMLSTDIGTQLLDSGVSRFIVSAYSTKMKVRVEENLSIIASSRTGGVVDKTIFPFISQDADDLWGDSKLDDRMTIYDRARQGDVRISKYGACSSPLLEVIISHTGDVVMCCLDWDDQVVYGNVYERPLAEILRSDESIRLYAELSLDIRNLSMCKACGWSRNSETML